jgi:hypothetical protein
METIMPWLYFNPEDKSLACRFDKKPSQEWIRRAIPKCIEVFKEEIILPDGCDDEANDLFLFEDGSVGLHEHQVRMGTKRYIRQSIDYLQMYAPLADEDRPQEFKEVIQFMSGHIPQDIIDIFMSDRVIDDDEKNEMLKIAGAL